MSPVVFAICINKLHEEFCKDDFALLHGDFITGPKRYLKLLEYATMFESEDAADLPPVIVRGFKSLSHEDAAWIVKIRNSEPFSILSLRDERFVYKTLRAVYAQGVPFHELYKK